YVMDYKGMPYATGSAFIWSGDIAYTFAKEIGLEPLPIDNWDGSIIKGEFIPDTWGDGLDKLPYPVSVRDSFKKFRDEMLAIDLQNRRPNLFNFPFSVFIKGHAPEVKQGWDNYAPPNWGPPSDETAATTAIAEL